MSVYDLKYNGMELIKSFVTTAMQQQVIEIEQLHARWLVTLKTWDDPYAQALVLNECDGNPWINPSHVYVNDDLMAKIFDEVLGGSTLKNLYSLVQRDMKGKLNKEAIISKIKQSTFFKEYEVKVLECIQSKKAMLDLCDKKGAEAVMTAEEREFSKVLNFDHYYDYSDDGQVWRNGNARHKEVVKIVAETLAEKPHLKKVVEVVATYYKLSYKFFEKA